MVDYKKEIAKAKKDIEKTTVEAIVLGPSGSGKSSLSGTFGCKTLYLFGSGEGHGPKAAATYGGGDLDAICIDKDRSPDEAIDLVMAVLADTTFLKEYGAIVIDGATEFESIIRNTERFKSGCMTDKGKHNSFAEGFVVLSIFRDIMKLLRATGKHYLVTCILDVQALDDETGEIISSSPRLSTYSVAEGLIQQFADVFVVGPMSNGTKTAHRIQFNSGVSKSAKDITGRVKKSHNFGPRLTGVKTLPSTMPASMTEVMKLKEGK